MPNEGQTRDAPISASSEKGKNTTAKPDVSPYKALRCGVNFQIYSESPFVKKSNVVLVNTSSITCSGQ